MTDTPVGPGRTILVLDDEPAIRSAARKVLELHGYVVLTAATADEARRVLDEHDGSLDLLLCDLVLPGLGGREAANVILARHPEARVLYMSGYSTHDSFRHELEGSEAAFLGKPFEVEDLIRLVDETLRGPATGG